MMKLRAGNLVILGLSNENILRLIAGKPILFEGEDINIPGIRFGIMHGQTEASMEKELINLGWKIPQ
ncbi:MAG TPA: hypothetical protein VF928_12730 [Usitatibacteraceae bacterium]